MHIRRTDQKKSIEFSPTDAFTTLMQEEIRQNPDAVFFLCSDDEEERKRILEMFGSRVVMQEKAELSRTSTEGMRAAVVDLFCLANTEKIYGSYWSSFSGTAAKLKGAKLKIVKVESEA